MAPRAGVGRRRSPAPISRDSPGLVQQQDRAPKTITTIKIKRVLDRDPTTEHIRTVAEWETDVPLAADGSPDLSALPREPPPA
jgi:hypothetical protein